MRGANFLAGLGDRAKEKKETALVIDVGGTTVSDEYDILTYIRPRLVYYCPLVSLVKRPQLTNYVAFHSISRCHMSIP